LWHEARELDWTPRPGLPGDREADVAIVGAGYTGLWSAYYLARADPRLRIAIVEAEVAGYGASGRNGGWCSALFPASADKLAKLPGSSRDLARAQHHAMRESVAEVGRVTALEEIRADYALGGTIVLARTPTQWRRAQAEVAHARQWGRQADDIQLLNATETSQRIRATGTIGATFTPDCAAIHPARLARGLADVVQSAGVSIYERTPATSIEPGIVRTRTGSLRAPYIVRATEGYTARLAGHRRAVVPVYSLIVATEPLSPALWDDIGLAQRETFSDHRHLIVYGQRTADDRLVFGGRGAPYHFGSRIQPRFDRNARVFSSLRETVVELFPMVARTTFTHAWGGALGIARDWTASVGVDQDTGLAWAGGYVGDGVATANLAGRTLCDLILGRQSTLTGLPWVNHRSRAWEPEPARFLEINAGLRAMSLADAEERVTGRSSRIARVMAPFLGG
jgi:glycine/D-amino acid oxidase-like deaminating enzyme